MAQSSVFNTFSWSQLRFIFDAIFEGVVVTDTKGIVRLINTTAQQLYHGMEAPTEGLPLIDANPHDWLETRRVLASGQMQLGRKLILAEAELLVNRLPILYHNEIVGVITTMQDFGMFDDIVKQLPKYRSLHDEMETILEQLDDAFIAVDAQGCVLRVNTAYERLTALARGALLGRNIAQLTRDPANIASILQTVLEQQRRFVNHIHHHDGSNFIITASPAFNDRGEICMVLVRIQNEAQLFDMQKLLLSREEKTTTPVSEEKHLEIQKICEDTGIIANSEAMLRLIHSALKVSQADSSVLLQGESGVGKSMLASLIHSYSPRKSNPFIVINAGAIPEELMESELFGYVKGAFTGALPQGKVGLLEAANKGTIFLDEIGEMKYSMQVKLLEIIEKKSFIRVGCTKRISVDVRIIAATNKNLKHDVEQGLFRKDLFYRLNVLPLYVPPLRERREDIQAMAQSILGQYNAKHKVQKKFSSTLMQWFSQHDFPGNMRELINILEWMIVMGEGDELNICDLPVALQKNVAISNVETLPITPEAQANIAPSHTTVEACIPQQILPLKEAMHIMERQYLEDAVSRYDNLQDAADALDVHFSTLWRKINQYNIKQKK